MQQFRHSVNIAAWAPSFGRIFNHAIRMVCGKMILMITRCHASRCVFQQRFELMKRSQVRPKIGSLLVQPVFFSDVLPVGVHCSRGYFYHFSDLFAGKALHDQIGYLQFHRCQVVLLDGHFSWKRGNDFAGRVGRSKRSKNQRIFSLKTQITINRVWIVD